MDNKIPIKLGKDPIVEAVFEIRFESKVKQVSEILPGLLFPSLNKDFPEIETLPTAQLPMLIRQNDPNLAYKPTHRLIGELYSIAFGEKVIGLSCPRPYQGWQEFRKNIMRLIEVLKGTNIIESINRFSIKYINVISSSAGSFGLDKLKLNIQLGDRDLIKSQTSISTQIKIDKFNNIVNIIPSASAKIKKTGETMSGLILDIDTIYEGGIGIAWDQLVEMLDYGHDTEKFIFYNVLKKETIHEYDPIWE